jgi:hypothetical protein
MMRLLDGKKQMRKFFCLLIVGMAITACSNIQAYPPPSLEVSPPPTVDTPSFFTAAPPTTSTPFPSPTSTFTPTIEEDFNVLGYGDFPLVPVIATASDGKTLALYMVEGNTATQRRVFEGTSWMDDHISIQTSPDNQHLAVLLQRGWDGTTRLEVMDLPEAESHLIAQGAGDLNPSVKASAFELITSSGWLDHEHLIYSKVIWPGGAEADANRQANLPFPIRGEIWVSTPDGKVQQLLTAAPIYRGLGSSPDGKTLYVTRLMPGIEEWRMEGFSLLDIASGKLATLWPSEKALDNYYNLSMISLPNGAPRILFVDGKQAPGLTVGIQPPDIWMGNPETRQAKAIWTITHGVAYNNKGTPDTDYYFPEEILWSPSSENEFVYSLLGDIWKVDLLNQTEQHLVEKSKRLWAWTPAGIIMSDNSTGVLQLVNEFGVVQGEIALGYIPPR